MEARSDHPGRLSELTSDECWDLIRARPVGRVAWSGPEGITVLPINFVVERNMIVLRTTPYSELAQHADDLEIAFEVDQIDEESHTGWSVLARGRCHRADVSPPSRPEVWVDGMRVLSLKIHVRSVSGRRVKAFFQP